ncbi:MAG: phosphatidate cytidylyltransferase [Sedimenticola sp.]
MLLQRVITALILIPLVITGVLYLQTPTLAALFALIVLLAAWEWAPLAGLTRFRDRLLFFITLTAGISGAYWLIQRPTLALALFAAGSLWWLFVTVILVRYRPERRVFDSVFAKAILGILVLVPAWAALVSIHGFGEKGPVLLLFSMTLTWVADSGAYFAGRRWGRVKLAPHISPGKTREGVYGALAGSALWGVLLAWYAPELGPLPVLVLFCLLLCLVSVVGDLFESLLKRQAGIKDSGNILPGHGGVLDRIDSMLAVAPLFAFGLMLLGGA